MNCLEFLVLLGLNLVLCGWGPHITPAAATPQIFTESHTYCDYELSRSKNRVKKLTFTDEIWTIERKDFILYFSFCKSTINQCPKGSSACLVSRGKSEVINFGKGFRKRENESPDEFILETTAGSLCLHPGKPYRLVVTFVCSNLIKAKPRLMMNEDEDECVYEVAMMRPDCKPKCTDFISGTHLIDIRRFPNNFEFESSGKNFSLAFCGYNKNCISSESASCEILQNGDTVPLANAETQRINYDVGKNELTARGSFKQGRVERKLEVLIKCNWESELSKPIFKKQPIQGRKYLFVVESSYGCIKLPQICTITTSRNVPYNLSQLNRSKGWTVEFVPHGQIVLNICGPLMHSSTNICSEQYSQVCHFDGKNYTNRGSVLSSLIANYDSVTAKFVSGSTCKENSTFLYSTEIEFRCSREENGPVFEKIENCVMFISWNSPHACALDYYKSSDCRAIDRLGNRNLKSLYSKTDKSLTLNPNAQLLYNLCGPLSTTCNNFRNASFCLKTRNAETVLGWQSQDVISENGLLRMEFTGDRCLNQRSFGDVTVHFVCSYANPSSPKIYVIEDSCKLRITIQTPLACISESRFDSCSVKNNQSSIAYNLAALSLKKSNYIIRDDNDPNIEYIFNICGPVITEQNVLCGHNTMICMRNKTELNIRKKYTSLGQIGGGSIENGDIVIKGKMGNLCDTQALYYETYFHFKCSQRHNYPKKQIFNDPCVYHFIWETPYACPINCKVENVATNIRLDLSKLLETSLEIKIDNGTRSYNFYLCRDLFELEVEGNLSILPYSRSVYSQNEKLYLNLNTSLRCTNGIISQVLIELHCQEGIRDYYESISTDNCIFIMLLHSGSNICPPKSTFANLSNRTVRDETIHTNNATTSETTTLRETIPEKVTPNAFSMKHCSVKSILTGYDLKLEEIKSKNKLLGNDQYAINFDGKIENCYGVLCRNSVQMLNSDECPATFFKDNAVILQYSPLIRCNATDFYDVKFQLECNETDTNEELNEFANCKIHMKLNSPQICPLFPKPHKILEASSNLSTIVGSIVGALLIVLSLIILIYFSKSKCQNFQYRRFSRHPKTEVPIYLRNVQD